MITLELFSGTESFSKVARARGHYTFTVDIEPKFNPSLVKDISVITLDDIPKEFRHPDVLWASIPCTCYSVASMGHHWAASGVPKTKEAEEAIRLAQKTISFIRELNPRYWFIENPRGMLRKLPVMSGLPRHTVAYCQYGDKRQKPTDIWTNCDVWRPKPMCKPGSPCHEAAPRGSRTGTQGLSVVQRSVIPPALFEEIFDHISNPPVSKPAKGVLDGWV